MTTQSSGFPGVRGGGGWRGAWRRNPVCLVLIALTVLIFLLDALASGLYRPDFSIELGLWLGCTPEGVLSGRIWQLLTYPFLPAGFLTTTFCAYFYYVFGRMLEARLGSWRFLGLYLWGSTGAAALATGLVILMRLIAPESQGPNLPAAFSLAPQLALLVVFALFQPNLQILLFFVIPVKMKFLAAFAVAAAGFATLTTLRWGAGFPHLVELCAALIGYLWFKAIYRLRLQFLQKYLGHLRFKRNKFKIIEGNRDDSVKNSDQYIN